MYRKNAATGTLYATPGEPPTALAPEEHPVPAVPDVDQRRRAQRRGVAEDREAVPAEHEREAHEEEGHEPESEDRKVRADHVRRVFRPAEPGLHEREARLHEDHEHRTDDDPEVVEPQVSVGDALDRIDIDGRVHRERGDVRHQHEHGGDRRND